MTTNLTKKINIIGEKVSIRNKEIGQIEAEISSDTINEQKPTKHRKGLSSDKIIQQAEKTFLRDEQLGLFDVIPVTKKNIFPTILTRIPIFMPITKTMQKKLLDEDNALSFETPFGSGKRYGPNLCVFDEDVLYALSKLTKKKLIGSHKNLPIRVSSTYKPDNKGNVRVNTVLCTISDILREIELSNGGRERTRVLDSLKRLTNSSITLTLKKNDRYLGNCEIGKSVKLIDIEWQLYSEEGFIYGQFSPVVTYWLEQEYTYLDWDIRKRLKSALAKALHRFLSGQINKKNKIFSKLNKIDDIAVSIGFHCRKRDIKKHFTNALDELVGAGYLTEFEITGTGRSEPFRLFAMRG